MKKKIATVIMTLAMTVVMAVPALAASGVSTNEQKVLDSFSAVVNSYETKGKGKTYISQAENALTQVDLDAAACNDLQAKVDEVAKYLVDNNITKPRQALEKRAELQQMVNATSTKYGITIAIDNVGDVTINIKKADGSTTKVGDNKNVVNFTGSNTTALVAGVLAVVAAVAAGIVMITKKGLLVGKN